jgi:hypothetical protein
VSARPPRRDEASPRCGLAVAAIATGLCAAACPGSTPDPDSCPAPGEHGVAVDDYCPELARTLCDGYAACCGLDDVAACEARVEAECEAGEISSIRAGSACLDPTVARECLDAWRDALADCSANEPLGEACRFQWYGHAGPGEPCRDVWWCTPGLGCRLDGTVGTCIELPDVGESCAETAACAPGGLFCSFVDWTCHREPGLDEPCERPGTCAAGACVEGTCQPVPWC